MKGSHTLEFLRKHRNLNQKINTKHCKMPYFPDIKLLMNKQRQFLTLLVTEG